VKGRYMWRDMEREAGALGLPCRQPDPFPQNSLLAARVALVGMDAGWGSIFSQGVYRAQFGEGRSIADPEMIADILLDLRLDATPILSAAQSEGSKSRLRAQCDEARERGIFGAPTFMAGDGEMFWGNDRLERALAWAARTAA
jgi:2-hydroxychromene-2-carboxylate isomerase